MFLFLNIFIWFNVYWDSWIYGLISLMNFRKFLAIFFLNISFAPASTFMLDYLLTLSHTSLTLFFFCCFFLFTISFFLQFGYFLLTYFGVSIFPAVISIKLTQWIIHFRYYNFSSSHFHVSIFLLKFSIALISLPIFLSKFFDILVIAILKFWSANSNTWDTC